MNDNTLENLLADGIAFRCHAWLSENYKNGYNASEIGYRLMESRLMENVVKPLIDAGIVKTCTVKIDDPSRKSFHLLVEVTV